MYVTKTGQVSAMLTCSTVQVHAQFFSVPTTTLRKSHTLLPNYNCTLFVAHLLDYYILF